MLGNPTRLFIREKRKLCREAFPASRSDAEKDISFALVSAVLIGVVMLAVMTEGREFMR